MKKLKIFLITILFFIFKSSFADVATCESGNYNYSGSTFVDICNGGNKFDNVVGSSTHSGSLQDINVGSFGNNYNLIEKAPEVYNYHTGFLGSDFKGRTVTDIYDIAPVGFLQSHIGKTFSFGERHSLYFSDGEKAELFGISSSHSGNNNVKYCSTPNNILNPHIRLKTDNYSDYLELSWDNHNDKIKIIQILPDNNITYIDDGNTFKKYNLKNNKGYFFFIVAYNDCGGIKYSDMLNIKYVKQDFSTPYLSFDGNTLRLENSTEVKTSNIKLSCSFNGDSIVNEFLDSSYSFSIDNKYTQELFSCYSEYFNKDGKLEKTPIFINDSILEQYISNREALEIILGLENIDNYFKKYLNHLHSVIDLDQRLDYGILSLLLLNTSGGIPEVRSDIALDVFKDINLLSPEVGERTIVSTSIFLSIFDKINSSSTFIHDLQNSMDKIFLVDDKELFFDLRKTYLISKKLENLTSEKRDLLFNCYTYNGCEDFDLYLEFDNNIEESNYEYEYKNLGIKQNNISTSWRQYINMIYRTFGKKGFYNGSYSSKQYDLFLNILLEAVLYGEDIGEENIDYFSYLRLKNSLLDSGLDKKLEKLVKYLKEITIIYERLDDKSSLFKVVKEFLEK